MTFATLAGVFACTSGGNVVNPPSFNKAVSVSYGTVESEGKLGPTGEIAGGITDGLSGIGM